MSVTTLSRPALTELFLAVIAHTVTEIQAEHHVKVSAYRARPSDRFGRCDWCAHEHQGEAVLSWAWDRWNATTDGSANSCVAEECTAAVMSTALQDSDAAGITLEYPVCPLPAVLAPAAALAVAA